jgi:glycosyltransferase involved in cell wall biosynthesis
MEEPLISVIIPVYKVEQYLDRCLNSVVNQTYKNLEIILVDDGSPDRCPKMCDEWAEKNSRVRVYHKENGGLSDARNYGTERCNGSYITYVDSDDYIDTDYVSYLYNLLSRYHTKMSICQHRVRYQGGKTIDYGSSGDEVLSNKRCLERMLYYDVIDTSAWAKLYKKELFADVKYPKGKYFEDLATTYKLMFKSDQIAVGYESKYNYALRNESISNSSFSPSKLIYPLITDATCDAIVDKFPDLMDAALARKVRSRFSVLNLMINVNEKGYKKEKKEYRTYILNNRARILKNNNVKKNEKIAICLISVNYYLYGLAWKLMRTGAI